MKLVVPGIWRGVPPVITTRSPELNHPEMLAASTAKLNWSSVVSADAINNGTMPQHTERKYNAALFGVAAMIG